MTPRHKLCYAQDAIDLLIARERERERERERIYLKTDLKYFTIKALILKYDAVKLFLITKH